MKEFIEKLIGRLEELKTFKLDLADAMSELMKKDRLDNYISKEEVVEIVNQLAEEYKGGWIPVSSGRLPEENEYVLAFVPNNSTNKIIIAPYHDIFLLEKRNDYALATITLSAERRVVWQIVENVNIIIKCPGMNLDEI